MLVDSFLHPLYIYIHSLKLVLDCLHDVIIYLYYALCFMLVEHSVCHEPISVLINVFMLLA